MDKRGAELSMNVIVVAVIALVVLAIVLAIFLSRSGKFNNALDEACMQNTGGTCQAAPCAANTLNLGSSLCEDKTQVCCKPIT